MLAIGTLLLMGGLEGCSPTGAALGITSIESDDRTLREQTLDAEIRISLNKMMFEADSRIYRAVGIQVWEGRVALTGAVSRPEDRDRVIAIAKSISGVKAVIDEIQIADEATLGSFINDTVIEERLKTRLLVSEDLQKVNVSIRAVNGVVYLLGVAHTQEELDRVIQQARDIDAVRKVVDHVRIRPKRQ
ncbi:MAG: BON domain-containing protein [Alphaproteobacteria bacterium]